MNYDKQETFERLEKASVDIAEIKREELIAIFPEVVTEGKMIDFERLKEVLGSSVDVGDELFGLVWPGKNNCVRTAQAPSLGTLLPCPEESIRFEQTENMIIEGDNLEVMKILRKSYFDTVKMIYIDPPYNTGNDFIYPDNYSESLRTYLEFTGQVNSEGKRYSTNLETDGRFHAKWLSMMYPRLYLARELLSRDGVIFISIDDSELANLRLLCNQLFGPENFAGVIKRRAARKTAFLSKRMTDMCDYVVAYVKTDEAAPLTAGQISDGTRPVLQGNNKLSVRTIKKGSTAKCPDNLYEKGMYTTKSNEFKILDDLRVVDGTVEQDTRIEARWRINQGVLDTTLFITRGFGLRRTMLEEELGKAKLLNDLLDVKECYNEKGSEEVKGLFGTSVFNNPKPRGLIEYLMGAVDLQEGDVIMDFFAGSGTTGHAVAMNNLVNTGSKFNYILVQLPEPFDLANKEHSVAIEYCKKNKLGNNIAELTKERLRLALADLSKEEAQSPNGKFGPDVSSGFKVFKLAESNFVPWEASVKNEADLKIQLKSQVEHIRPGRTDADLLHEIMLRSGIRLSEKYSFEKLENITIYIFNNAELAVCLGDEIGIADIKLIADKRPKVAVFLDAGFAGNDQLKANAAYILKTKDIRFRTI